MLILSRKSRESIIVGDSDGLQRLLTITVLELNQGRVKLGFDVAPDVPVHRAEVWKRIHGGGALADLDRRGETTIKTTPQSGARSKLPLPEVRPGR
jgi:carbon storage regulator CsrA